MNLDFENFVDIENFKLAYKRIKTASKSSYKDYYHDDFKYFDLFIDEYITSLVNDISEGIYEPSKCERYHELKNKGLSRHFTMLSLIDQIVYQAIANFIADEFHSKLSKYFGKNIYGNIFKHSTEENNIFFYRKWKEQLNKYITVKKNACMKGFVYYAEYDIASFYDNIDHNILLNILAEYEIDEKIIELLGKCLAVWTLDTTSKSKCYKSCGIPQGPVSSAFFAEIYLSELDNEMRKHEDIKYFRYADDICVMAKTKGRRDDMLLHLDLATYNLSLSPQSEKIKVDFIDNKDQRSINTHIRKSTLQFSQIANEYKYNSKSLKSKTHNSLKKKFIGCLNSNDLNKTIIKFSLFKFNMDFEIRDIIIEKIELLDRFYEGICYYFSTYFPYDIAFYNHVLSCLLNKSDSHHYNKAVIFKNYKILKYDESVLTANLKIDKAFWIVTYQMICWLERCGHAKVAIESYKGNNYYINRKINEIKCQDLVNDKDALKVYLQELIANESPLVSMQGLYLWNKYIFCEKPDVSESMNSYVRNAMDRYIFDYFTYTIKKRFDVSVDYFIYTMKKQFDVSVPYSFLNMLINIELCNEVKEDLQNFIKYREVDPSKSLLNINLLNNIIFDMLLMAQGKPVENSYGSQLQQIEGSLPVAYAAFESISNARNQFTDAHYTDKEKRHRKRITKTDFAKLIKDASLHEAYSEIFEAFVMYINIMYNYKIKTSY